MDNGDFKELHEAIEKGDFEVVRSLLQEHPEERYFSYNGESALFKAISCKNYEILSYLFHIGAKVHGPENGSFINISRINFHLLNYNRKTEKSCIHKFISCSHSPQGLEGETLGAIVSMYEDFFKSENLKLLMKVIEVESFDIVYDFSSEDVNRIHRFEIKDLKCFGCTGERTMITYIGAKNLLSGEFRKRSKVYEHVANELCYVALTMLFMNDAKPYRETDFNLKQKYFDIVTAVQTLLSRSCHVDSVIEYVFSLHESLWEEYLIACVPCVIARYGEEMGRRVFMETPELCRLMTFYEEHVKVKCKEYVSPMIVTKAHQLRNQLFKMNDFISAKEKQTQPLNESFPSFRDFLVKYEYVYVITTNCTKLCALQVYHELEREYKDQLEKKCLFFTTESFKKYRDDIWDAINGMTLDYLILVQDEKELNLRRFVKTYEIYFGVFNGNGIKTLLIFSACQSFGSEFEYKTENYKWNDVTEEYKGILENITYELNGEQHFIRIPKEDFQSIFSEEEIMMIMNGSIFEVNDGRGLFSEGYIQETYIERNFQEMTVDKKIFVNLPEKVSIFITGMVRVDGIKSLDERCIPLIDEKQVQWL